MSNLKTNISKFFADAEKKAEAGVYAVANEGLALAKTYTPVDTSNLINSEIGPLISKTQSGVKAVVGFNAEYAFYVHNKTGKLKGIPRANGNGYYWSPDAEPKFLVKGFEELKPIIPKIIKAAHETK